MPSMLTALDKSTQQFALQRSKEGLGLSNVFFLLLLAFCIWAFVSLALSTDKSEILPNYSNYILAVGNIGDFLEEE